MRCVATIRCSPPPKASSAYGKCRSRCWNRRRPSGSTSRVHGDRCRSISSLPPMPGACLSREPGETPTVRAPEQKTDQRKIVGLAGQPATLSCRTTGTRFMHRRSLFAASLLAAPLAVRAQSLFGERPIRMIVPVAVAGASDIVARIVADAMTPLLGRQIVVENIAGAGSTLGANTFQQTPVDGQTIYVPTNNHALMKLVYPQFAYDPAADFVPVAVATRQPFVLAVHTSVPANTVPELIA